MSANLEECAGCGVKMAEGFAFINDERFCHGDWPFPSCYELACWEAETDMMTGWFDTEESYGH